MSGLPDVAARPEEEGRNCPPRTMPRGRAHRLFNQRLGAGGHRVIVAGPLTPSAEATSMRPTAAGGTLITDGPFTESREQIVGFYLIESADEVGPARDLRGPGEHSAI